MIDVPNEFKPHINTCYPPNNCLIFEEWFFERYKSEENNTNREYLPIFWTSYHVNNNYGNNPVKRKELQEFIDGLDRSKKYFTILQYDDGCLVDFKDLDIQVFGASGKDATDDIPLLCQPQPFKTASGKALFISFIGSHTHPIREKIFQIKHTSSHISDKQYSISNYCQILTNTVFSLCPRGYGINSFRIAESVQYGAIPVYISDEFSIPKWMNFEEFGVIIKEDEDILTKLNSIPKEEVERKLSILPEIYQKYYTYESNYNFILEALK